MRDHTADMYVKDIIYHIYVHTAIAIQLFILVDTEGYEMY